MEDAEVVGLLDAVTYNDFMERFNKALGITVPHTFKSGTDVEPALSENIEFILKNLEEELIKES